MTAQRISPGQHSQRGNVTKYRAVIKKVRDWWIGWLVDLPGVNAKEKTKEDLSESLKIGAQEMLATDVPFEPEAAMPTFDVPDPEWGEMPNN